MTLKQLTEESDPYCLHPLDAAALLFDAPWSRLAVIGDSLSAGTGDPSPGYADAGWSDRLASVLRRVRPDLEYLNTAEVGATTEQTLGKQIDRLREFGPDLVHLPCGANDLVRRQPDFDQIEQKLRRLYVLASRTGAQLTTFTLGRAYLIPAFPDWAERVARVNAITRTLAAEYGAVIVDMWDHPVNARENLVSEDRIHFSASGQAVLATEMVKGLAHVLSRTRGD
ncbi:SGNH/GDSL hydrolase family protein [Streptomyces sp. NBC_00059]|uniref:SGNH/GDSL hydrolase family protein n=1 Tax=Streptomyces sp. NBC_00059 TaxID=2975635 RepID=UPI00225961D7|nr:SGNH/GDSL hydrolase family protein [Streptomyces sp. NBC_00059]MCX5416146.1 SGNH/GDSL hydrolase family protein [Streptomyces sp. NBC_00059]